MLTHEILETYLTHINHLLSYLSQELSIKPQWPCPDVWLSLTYETKHLNHLRAKQSDTLFVTFTLSVLFWCSFVSLQEKPWDGKDVDNWTKKEK